LCHNFYRALERYSTTC